MIAETKYQILNTLKDWLLNLEGNYGVTYIDADENLIDAGLIDSLEFVSFLLVLEELRGTEISSFEMELDKFKTLNTILENFF